MVPGTQEGPSIWGLFAGEAPKKPQTGSQGGSSTTMLFNRPSAGSGRRAGLSHGGLSTSQRSGVRAGAAGLESWWGIRDPVNLKYPRRTGGAGRREGGAQGAGRGGDAHHTPPHRGEWLGAEGQTGGLSFLSGF